MNQTFDFKRFWQYATSYISLNKSFLKLMAVLFMVPAVLSLCGANQIIVFAALSLCAALLPIRTNIPDWPPCVSLPEASVLEKFATETSIKIVYLLIPITIHAAFVIGQQSPFTDGFQIEFILYTWINIWMGTFTANCSAGQRMIYTPRNTIEEYPYYSTFAKCFRVIDSITMVGSVGLLEFFFTGYNCWRLPFSTKANWFLFAGGMVLLILQYFHYYYVNTKKFANRKYYELPDGSRVWEKE